MLHFDDTGARFTRGASVESAPLKVLDMSAGLELLRPVLVVQAPRIARAATAVDQRLWAHSRRFSVAVRVHTNTAAFTRGRIRARFRRRVRTHLHGT